VTWRMDSVDLEQNTTKVPPGKTQNCANPIRLEIVMDSALRDVVKECPGSSLACPFLIHDSPKARMRERLDAERQWNAVMEDYLTWALTKAHDASKADAGMPKAEPLPFTKSGR
jgi:enterobacteria phage integrase